jgi:cell wall-associated NlpC family hydrolase
VTERATGRHRATQKSSSALSTLTGSLSVVGDCVGSVRRSGVIIAMSSGLVASMALPAHAVGSGPAEAAPQTASVPVVPATGVGPSALAAPPQGSMLVSSPETVLAADLVRAATTATVDFDHTSFIAVPGPNGITLQTVPSAAAPKVAAAPAGGSVTHQSVRLGGAAPAPKAAPKVVPASTNGQSTAVPASAANSAAVAIATRYLHVPYVWGGTTPSGFDCSGLVQYVYAQLGKRLPRTVAAQRGAVRIIARSEAQPGDLVIFGTSHIGIYVGNNMMIDAPHTGMSVTMRKIYSASVVFGRV